MKQNVVLLNPYYWLEDKWYELIDALDKRVPIAGAIDKIDEIVPSFIIFLLVTVVALAALFYFFQGIWANANLFEVRVLTKDGAPIESAIVSLAQDCQREGQDITIATNSKGIAAFSPCAAEINATVSKEGFKTTSGSMLASEKTKTFYLEQSILPSKQINVQVLDAQQRIIREAKLSLVCSSTAGTKETLFNPDSKQPAEGFEVLTPSNCESIKLKAAADGFEEKSVTFSPEKDSVRIVLDASSLKGTAVFTVQSPNGPVGGATITLTDQTGSNISKDTTAAGEAIFESISAGVYDYTVYAGGDFNTGSFDLGAGELKDITVEFATIVDANNSLNADQLSYLYILVMDSNTGVLAQTEFYYSDQNATSLFATKTSSIAGEVTPLLVTDLNKTYSVLVKAIGYKVALVQLAPRKKNAGPQIIKLNQGGAKIKLTVLDDTNTPINSAAASLYLGSFAKPIYNNLLTDYNGTITFNYLPDGNYRIDANKGIETGSMAAAVFGADQQLTINLATGSGSVSFNLYKVDALRITSQATAVCRFKEKNPDGSITDLNSAVVSLGSSCAVSNVKAGKQIFLSITDSNYLSYESQLVTIKRGTQKFNAYLRKPSELPNQNPAQLILRQVYKSNPFAGNETIADTFFPGTDYYLAFDLVITSLDANSSAANFFVGPKEVAALDQNAALSIRDAYSVNNSVAPRTDLMADSNSFFIDTSYTNTHLDSDKAKQLNVLLGGKRGTVIPIVLKVSTDANAAGRVSLYFESFGSIPQGNYFGIESVKDFNIGQKFCLADCPALLYSNYLKWNDNNYAPAKDLDQILVDDNYLLKTTVENTTDRDFGSPSIYSQILGSYLSFAQDKNSVLLPITLPPLALSQERTVQLVTKNSPGSPQLVSVLQKVVDPAGNDIPSTNTNTLKLRVRTKDQLDVALNAVGIENVIYEKAIYPTVILKTYYLRAPAYTSRSGAAALTHWYLYLDNGNGALNNQLASGTTDASGTSIFSLDFSNLVKGSKLILIAEDDLGSISARKEIYVTGALGSVIVQPKTQCLDVKIGGVSYKQNPDTNIGIDLSSVSQSTAAFTIDYNTSLSDCNAPWRVQFDSDIQNDMSYIPGVQPSPLSDSSPTLEVTINPNSDNNKENNTLGYHFLTIYYNSPTDAGTLAVIPVIVDDSNSCFSLNKYTFDFTQTNQVSARITNNCFAGRKDYLPTVDISTSSVAVQYTKPGIPASIDINATVIASAIEGIKGCAQLASNIATDSNFNLYPTQITVAPLLGAAANAYCNPAAASTSTTLNKTLYSGQSASLPSNPAYAIPSYYGVKISSSGTPTATTQACNAWSNWALNDKISPAPNCSALGCSYLTAKFNSLSNVQYGVPNKSYHMDYPPAIGFPYAPTVDFTTSGKQPQVYSEDNGLLNKSGPIKLPSGIRYHNDAVTANAFCRYFGYASGSVTSSGGWSSCGDNGYYYYDGSAWVRDNGCSKVSNTGIRALTCSTQYVCPTPAGKPTTPTLELLFGANSGSYADPYGNKLTVPQFGSSLLGYTASNGGPSAKGDNFTKSTTSYNWLSQAAPVWYGKKSSENNVILSGLNYLKQNACSGSNCILSTGAYLENKYYYFKITNPLEMFLQFDRFLIEERFVERKQTIQLKKTINPSPTQTVFEIGYYGGATPAKSWGATPSVNWGGNSIGTGTGFGSNYSYFQFQQAASEGFLNPSIAPTSDSAYNFPVRSKSDKVSIDSNVVYYIPTESLALPGNKDVNLYLDPSNKKLYAKYTVVPAISGNNIDLNVVKVNLNGEEYAQLTVKDYTSGISSSPKSRTFLVKLKGNAANCYNGATPGYSGSNAVLPRISTSWDWNAINYNSCDATNSNYVYCDATQFTISLMKRLALVDSSLQNKDSNLPALVGFYAYLMKDNYSQNLLDDFKDYYNNAFISSNSFNSLYSKYIRDANGETRLGFALRNAAGEPTQGGELTEPGRYRIDLNIVYDDPEGQSLFSLNEPSARIIIGMKLESPPEQKSIFYSMPFDGPIGQNGSRSGYGTSETIKQDSGMVPQNELVDNMFNGALVDLNSYTASSLSQLDSGLVLSAKSNSLGGIDFGLFSSRPTPVAVALTSNNGIASLAYNLTTAGSPTDANLNKKWNLIGSTINPAQCADFSGAILPTYATNVGAGSTRTLNWNGNFSGTITIATTFFAPKSVGAVTQFNLTNSSPQPAVVSSLLKNGPNGAQLSDYTIENNPNYNYYGSVQEIFNAVREGKMCISQNQEDSLSVWWSQNYLNTLQKSLPGVDAGCIKQ